METKLCKKCGTEKEISNFIIGKYRYLCKDCNRIKGKEYRERHKDKIKNIGKIYREKNEEKIKIYREENKEKYKDYHKAYSLIYEKLRKQSDPIYKLACNMRSMNCFIFTNNGYRKTSKTQKILGCTFEEFKNYLESKFEIWMSWENYGKYNGELNYGWDIDHIIPLYEAKTEDDLIKLNNYTNLQPLCSKVNRVIKRNKILWKK